MPNIPRPRKRFGQHFLVDQAVIDAIVSEIAPRPGQFMVEIGPGLAALTQPLVERLGHLTVVELDRDLVARLRSQANLSVLQADALSLDYRQLASAQQEPVGTAGASRKMRLVGNLPYNISTPLLFHLLDQVDVIEDQHFMLQKEVVDRMVASPATSSYGRMSVMLQWRYAMERILLVAPQAFRPPPQVESAVVRMLPLEQPINLDPSVLGDLVRAAFSQRRKLLRHSLGQWLDRQGYSGRFELQRRAEEVSVIEYLQLSVQLEKEKGPVRLNGPLS